ncbi:MAG TPA: hypothetical protein VJZ77_12955 [Blastocatellia bacterium]|nr:hypothetical protein [Blastocatellia bacterium]
MGVTPEASAEEIRDAIQEVDSSLKKQKEIIEKQIEEVYQAIDGLKNAYAEVKDLQTKAVEADSKELRAARKKLAELEQKAEAVSPNFKRLRESSSHIEMRIHEINRIALGNPKARLAYDRANPPLELLKLGKCARDEFTESKTALALLRRELSEFLAAQGEEVFHPSDLTRQDFSADFIFNPRLDGVEP